MNWSDYFWYDATSRSGLRWKVERTCGKGRVQVRPGDMAGSKNKKGYWTVDLNDHPYLCHRIIFELMDAKIPDGMFVDHINGDRSDNRHGNLRLVSRQGNSRNAKMPSHNTSGKVGVSRHEVVTKTKVYPYWTAHYSDLTGKSVKKVFSVLKLGEEQAFAAACKYRDDAIAKLNAEGAGYTERHGKEL